MAKLIPNQEPEPLPRELYEDLAESDLADAWDESDGFDPDLWRDLDREADCD